MNDDIWETFCDESYYHMWCLRKIGQCGFNDGFHINNRKEAIALCDLINKMERELAEAKFDLEFRRELYALQTEELAEAREENKRLIADMILHERMASTFQDQRERLAEAGQAVVDRWHTPLWKDAPHTAGFIQNLADAIVAVKGGAHE